MFARLSTSRNAQAQVPDAIRVRLDMRTDSVGLSEIVHRD